MKKEGHHIHLVARSKKIIVQLLNYYKIDYSSRGRGSDNIIGKLINMIKADYLIFRISLSFKPDLFLSFGSI